MQAQESNTTNCVFVVVENAGLDNETVVLDDATLSEAHNYKDTNYSTEEIETLCVDIMFRSLSGTLTTEF